MSEYTEQVRAYLAYCREAAAWMAAQRSALDAQYHPTAAGAVKMIPHDRDPAGAKAIRQAYTELAGQEQQRQGRNRIAAYKGNLFRDDDLEIVRTTAGDA